MTANEKLFLGWAGMILMLVVIGWVGSSDYTMEKLQEQKTIEMICKGAWPDYRNLKRRPVEAWGNEQIVTQRFIELEAKWNGIEIDLDATPMLVVEEFNQIVLENHS